MNASEARKISQKAMYVQNKLINIYKSIGSVAELGEFKVKIKIDQNNDLILKELGYKGFATSLTSLDSDIYLISW